MKYRNIPLLATIRTNHSTVIKNKVIQATTHTDTHTRTRTRTHTHTHTYIFAHAYIKHMTNKTEHSEKLSEIIQKDENS